MCGRQYRCGPERERDRQQVFACYFPIGAYLNGVLFYVKFKNVSNESTMQFIYYNVANLTF
jgi:hypothetical protein